MVAITVNLFQRKYMIELGKLMQEMIHLVWSPSMNMMVFLRLHKEILPNNSEIKHKWLSGDLLGSEEVIGDDGFGNARQLQRKLMDMMKREEELLKS